MFPLELQQGSRASSRVTAKTQGSSLVVAGNSGFPQELQQGTESSSQSAVINQCSSGFAAQDAVLHWSCGGSVGVLLKLGWYLGFLVTCSGTSCRVLLGCFVSSRDVQGGSCLVAVMDEFSLVLASDYSIIVVEVHPVIAGVLSLSSGGVPAPLSLSCEVHLYYQKRGSSLHVMSAGSSEVWLRTPLDRQGCVLSGWCVHVSTGNVLCAFGAMDSSLLLMGSLLSSCEGLHSTSFRELVSIGGRRSL